MNSEPGLEPTVRRSITRAGDLKHKRVHEVLGQLGLYPGQTFVLYALWSYDGLTQSELAERLNRSPSTITKKIQRMEKAGFVIRRSDDSDERISRVFLTDAGREVRSAVEEAWNRLDCQIFTGFAAPELALFHEFLLRVCWTLENASSTSTN